jgi:hypothetical protein
MARKTEPALYAAKLLYQIKVTHRGRVSKRRVCEERIIVFPAKSADDALRVANKFGRSGNPKWRDSGRDVAWEFVGLLDLFDGVDIHDPRWEPQEVWSTLFEMMRPMERRRQLIPPKRDLKIFSGPKHARNAIKLMFGRSKKAKGRTR